MKIFERLKELKNYKFMDSKKVLEIQISDCIVFLISTFYYFIMFNTQEYIDNFINNMCDIQKNNFKLLINLIEKSNLENGFFIETINSNRAVLYRNTMIYHIKFLLSNF